MRWWIALGAAALLAIGAMMWLVLADAPPAGEGAVIVTQPEPDRGAPDGGRRLRPLSVPRLGDGPRQRPDGGSARSEGPVDENTVKSFGQEFERKWFADRERLGAERHREMERLWWEGARRRGDPEASAALERLLKEFPDTNRAGCAALELGQQAVRDPRFDLAGRREQAISYWTQVQERYRDTLCEYNAPAAAMAKLGLATWVYRQTDPATARRLLEEIIREHPGETDHLGQPLEKTARMLLEQLK